MRRKKQEEEIKESNNDRGNKMVFIESLLMPEAPVATVIIMLICMTISFCNSSINRLLISRFVGWEQYKIMQKDIANFRTQTTQAMRKKDTKLMEKLKKKEPQIINMQKKMAKPQSVLFVLSFSYILIWWFVLLPLYGGNIVAHIPGIGGIPVVWWYFICSFLFGTLASRVLGVMPIE